MANFKHSKRDMSGFMLEFISTVELGDKDLFGHPKIVP